MVYLSNCIKLIALISQSLILIFFFFTLATAADPNQTRIGDMHPKLTSRLWHLKNAYEKREVVSEERAVASMVHVDEVITVYIVTKPGTMLDERSLNAYGADIIKYADNVWEVIVSINMLETIADNIDEISFIKLPISGKPSAVESEGVSLTRAKHFQNLGVAGQGVTVAVIDLGFAGLVSASVAGELPLTIPSDTKIDCTGGNCQPADFSSETDNHGTAVAEIVYDMAPDAKPYFIKVKYPLDLKLAKDFCVANDVDIINHSVAWFNYNFYSGGCYNRNPVCTADEAYDSGILWVNSIGNHAEEHYGGTYEDADADGYHDEIIEISAVGGKTIEAFLTWDDWPVANQDYDLYLYYDNNPSPVDRSETIQGGQAEHEPSESIEYEVPLTQAGKYYLKIKKHQATSNHRLSVFVFNTKLITVTPESSLASPADSAKVMAVGAIDEAHWSTGPQESYSSRGPTYDNRKKPEICGPDYVSNFTYTWFDGTSAASPHVAGAAALIKSKNPAFGVQKLWNSVIASTIDMGEKGQDNIYGYGRLNIFIAWPSPWNTLLLLDN